MMLQAQTYRPRCPSTSRHLDIRGLRCHVRMWGEPDAEPLVLLHGGRDASATFQFVVDAMSRPWRLIAPDWRGHGLSGWAPQGYWFQDYLADLDAFLHLLFPDRAVHIAGHSLGGNVASVYAGLRPERVARLISLDGFGLPDKAPEDAPEHLRGWLDSLRIEPSSRPYDSLADMADRLMAANPRLDAGKAAFLAEHLSRPLAEGGYAWAFDPAHRRRFAALYRFEEWAACIRRIEAPMLWIGSGHIYPPGLARDPDGFARRLALPKQASFLRIDDTGHNLHHDAPEAVAAALEDFLS